MLLAVHCIEVKHFFPDHGLRCLLYLGAGNHSSCLSRQSLRRLSIRRKILQETSEYLRTEFQSTLINRPCSLSHRQSVVVLVGESITLHGHHVSFCQHLSRTSSTALRMRTNERNLLTEGLSIKRRGHSSKTNRRCSAMKGDWIEGVSEHG